MKPQDAAEQTIAQKVTAPAAAFEPVNPAMANSDENNDVAGPRPRPSEGPEGAKSPERPAYSPMTSRESSPVVDSRTQEPSQNAAEMANDETDLDYEAKGDDNDYEYDNLYPAKTTKMSTTAPSRKIISSKTKRAESADEASLSPTSAPKTKKRRTMQVMPDSFFDKPNTDMQRASAGNKQITKVQLSIATGLDPPTDITKPKICEPSQLNTLTNCRAAVIDDFLADIKAAGFNEEVHIFIFRLDNLDRLLATESDEEEEDEWLTIGPSGNAEYKKWISKVSSSITNEHVPRIQVVLVADNAFAGGRPLLRRKEKQSFHSISTSATPKKKEIVADESPKTTKKTRAMTKKPEDRSEGSDASDYEDVRRQLRRPFTTTRRSFATTRRLLTTMGRPFATTRRPLRTTKTLAPFKKPEVQAEQADLSDSNEDDEYAPRRQAKATVADDKDSLVFRKLKEVEAELKDVKAELKGLKTENTRLNIKAKLTADAAWGAKEESKEKLQKTELARRRLMIDNEVLKSRNGQFQSANVQLGAANAQLSSLNAEFRAANNELLSLNAQYSGSNEQLRATVEQLEADNAQLRAERMGFEDEIDDLVKAYKEKYPSEEEDDEDDDEDDEV